MEKSVVEQKEIQVERGLNDTQTMKVLIWKHKTSKLMLVGICASAVERKMGLLPKTVKSNWGMIEGEIQDSSGKLQSDTKLWGESH